ncbi:fasciclin domain-containing protein, partial [Salmonella sp. s55033]|uniref:fasciclin domain-containing protein n=1 Tax=Salmonella sp. s55033 TaxID=3159676 RepID=UPI003980CB06
MLEELAGLSDVTIFAPSNKAIEELPEEVLERLTSDPTKLRDSLSYHIATPALQAENIENNFVATTRTEHPLRINLDSRTPLLVGLGNGRGGMRMTAGCSRVSVLDQRAC